jgi:hypothetical protein
MSEDWLPPEPPPVDRLSQIKLIGGGVFTLILLSGLYLQMTKPEQLPSRHRALGEVYFLFGSNKTHTPPSKYESTQEQSTQNSLKVDRPVSSDHAQVTPRKKASKTIKTDRLLILDQIEAPVPQTIALAPKKDHTSSQKKSETRLAVTPSSDSPYVHDSDGQREADGDPTTLTTLPLKSTQAYDQGTTRIQKTDVRNRHTSRQASDSEKSINAISDLSQNQKIQNKTKSKLQVKDIKGTQTKSPPQKRSIDEKATAKSKSKVAPSTSLNPSKNTESGQAITWDQASYTLQVKAFRSEEEASKFLDLIDQSWPHLPTRIVTGTSRNKSIYRVLLGAFENRDDAKVIRREFMTRFGSKDKPFIKSIQ